MNNVFKASILFIAFSTITIDANGQNDNTLSESTVLKHSFSTDPLLPLFNSFAIIYEYEKTEESSIILGFWYGKSTETYPKMLEYPGYVVSISPIFAYRYYFWKNFHLEYQLYPGFTKYYHNSEDKYFRSFSLFNEFRVGYRFEFQISELPMLLNLQIPVGFTIFDTNEPGAFKRIRKQDPIFFLFYPNIYFGIRF